MTLSAIIPSNSFSISEKKYDTPKCNCVVFRLDDLHDTEFQAGQIIPMELFLSKNQTLSLALIMNLIGNDSKVINKVQEGVSKGLFELGIHGWNHTDYRNLTQKEQRNSLELANEKMKLLFGKESKIFIPPDGEFNNDTIKAMNQLGFRIISSGMWAEESFDQGKSIFNTTAKVQENDSLRQQIFHLPITVSFKDYDNGKWIKNSIENIVNNATNSIDKYGYAIIVIHPQDFLKIENGEFVDILVPNEIKDLSLLIDSILSRGIDIVSFSKLVGIEANE
jgi:peptidoglycan/xylan/chitin deacetylase (PgdA/CDA1 family)